MNKLILTLSLLISCGAFAQENITTEQTSTVSAPERWKNLSEDEKNRIRENYRKWKSMSPEQRQQLKQRYHAFRKFNPEARARMLKNYKRFKQLPPERQKQIREKYRRFMSLPPAERKKRIEFWSKRRNKIREHRWKRNRH